MRSLSPKQIAAFALAMRLARPALAADSSFRLAWHAPAGCPSEAAFRAEVAERAGSVAHEKWPAITVRVVVTQRANGVWEARITTSGEGRSGQRRVGDTRCENVSHAAALIIALTLTPVTDDATPPVRPSSVTRRSVQVGLGLDLLASSGNLPGLGLGAQSRLALALEPLALELRAAGFFPQSEALASAPQARMQLVTAELGLAGCYAGKLTLRLSWQGCGGVSGDWMHATSSGVTNPGSATGIWPTPFLELVARWVLSEHGGLRMAAQAGRALAAPRFAIAGDGVFFRPANTTFRVTLGAELHF